MRAGYIGEVMRSLLFYFIVLGVPQTWASRSTFLMQSAAVAGDPSNELQPASLGFLRPAPSVSLSAQQIGDTKYEYSQGPIKLPFESGGTRLVPLSVVSAQGTPWGGYALYIESREQILLLNSPFLTYPGYSSELNWNLNQSYIRTGVGAARRWGAWSVGASISVLQTSVDFRGSITGSGLGNYSIADSETSIKSVELAANLGVLYQGETWTMGAAARSSGHPLSRSGRSKRREIQVPNSGSPKTDFQDAEVPVGSTTGEGALGLGYRPSEWVQLMVEYRQSTSENTTALAADFGDRPQGYMVALSQTVTRSPTLFITAETATQQRLLLSYRRHEKRFGWMAGPYYELTKSGDAETFNETSYGIRFATEILY